MFSLRFLANMVMAGLVALSAPWALAQAEHQFPKLAHLHLPRFDSPTAVLLAMAVVGLLALRKPDDRRRA